MRRPTTGSADACLLIFIVASLIAGAIVTLVNRTLVYSISRGQGEVGHGGCDGRGRTA